MKQYVITSLETHLFFIRIMKEHSLFLLAGFPAEETGFRNKADWLREQFEDLLRTVVCMANGLVRQEVLDSGEIVTEFTEMAEKKTSCLTGIEIDGEITKAEHRLQASCQINVSRRNVQQVRQLNRRVLWLLNELIVFKEKILRDVAACNLYTTNYPLLIEHILREAKLYRQIINGLERNGCMPAGEMRATEMFWNQIMMEHAFFIRGLLDPTECELLKTADGFAGEYCRLLEEAGRQECRAEDRMTEKSLELTKRYRDFKAAGAEGITDCKIRSIILPLLADHVLREANHYLRILESGESGTC